ncbi:TetR/AcrR family transcriptional regulator [Hyphomonas pacifica]|uniref:Uncharacterized protein n=1 Tax=Hyphomonas pacifica TaxID=1280941 RepID=A0A062U734_9PROT|nr:TetR/AcrR family transcriptional regulator [Hyphomonas pacifica]KCZ52444.1 hypothetical protein HY2_08500 [Hyphomonas pacifica]RAN35217.1 hypothetical protein HY3_09100 [Hyphomonas pacifica]RAN37310.1 hypothetical protein HY11_09450 [Hyphomonas pacifica]
MTEKKRRKPTQKRAQATVEAILEAAFQILEAEGLSNLTTNHIAERAGVSIGTLYQYFEDRDAILLAIAQKESDEIRQLVTEIILETPEISSIRAIVRALIHGPQGSPETRIALSDVLFRNGGATEMSRQHLALLASLQESADVQLNLGREATFILTHAAIYLLRAAAAEPELELDTNILEDEIVYLMESYINNLAMRSTRID